MGESISCDFGAFCPHCNTMLHRWMQKVCGKCNAEIDWAGEVDWNSENFLYGGWKRDGKRWEPERNAAFSALCRSNDGEVAIVRSQWVRYGRAGTMCIPGQVHAEPDDPTSPFGLALIELKAGTLHPLQRQSGRQFYHPYYALPEYCLLPGK
jgi:hypothetical protein